MRSRPPPVRSGDSFRGRRSTQPGPATSKADNHSGDRRSKLPQPEPRPTVRQSHSDNKGGRLLCIQVNCPYSGGPSEWAKSRGRPALRISAPAAPDRARPRGRHPRARLGDLGTAGTPRGPPRPMAHGETGQPLGSPRGRAGEGGRPAPARRGRRHRTRRRDLGRRHVPRASSHRRRGRGRPCRGRVRRGVRAAGSPAPGLRPRGPARRVPGDLRDPLRPRGPGRRPARRGGVGRLPRAPGGADGRRDGALLAAGRRVRGPRDLRGRLRGGPRPRRHPAARGRPGAAAPPRPPGAGGVRPGAVAGPTARVPGRRRGRRAAPGGLPRPAGRLPRRLRRAGPGGGAGTLTALGLPPDTEHPPAPRRALAAGHANHHRAPHAWTDEPAPARTNAGLGPVGAGGTLRRPWRRSR